MMLFQTKSQIEMTTSEPEKYIQSVLLEILNRSVFFLTYFPFRNTSIFRPAVWLGKGKRNHLNIKLYDAQKAALSFLQQYNRESILKGQRVNNTFLNRYS